MSNIFKSSLIFWLGWVVLPLIIEVIPAIGNFILLIIKKIKIRYTRAELKFCPPVSIIVPVYNSSKTLYACLKSIAMSDYELNKIDVMCIDNGSKDDSFEIFRQCQIDFPNLSINWLKSAQGKSNALNMAIYNAEGKYIVNIDSDGVLEKKSIRNLVRKFENNENVNCMTGAVLIEPRLVEEESKKAHFLLKLIQKCEFMEYCQAFLAGRNFQAETNSIFTMSGAFSAFRKSTLMKTRMYNSETICEDTHMTFQIKENMGQKVYFCEDALFFVDPIESINKLYTQRQRWQIGELEVSQMFVLNKMRNPINIIKDSATRLMVMDHTMVFPKIAWLFVLAIMCIVNRTTKIAVITTLMIYGLGVFTSGLFSLNALSYLKDFGEVRDYYKKNLGYVLLLPIYSYFTYLVRLCGILNSIGRASTWKTKNFSEEWSDIRKRVDTDSEILRKIRDISRKVLEVS